MRNIIRSSFILAASAFALVAQAAMWNVDPAHSAVSFAVKHMVFATVRGTFDTFEGTVNFDENNPGTFTVEASADAASVDTRSEKRDADLRSANFFDSEKFPKLTFKSRSVKKISDGQYTMTGDLTIHGVTKEVTFELTGLNGTTKDPWGGTRTAASATATINREDFGLNWNKDLEGGRLLVSKEVTITLDVELVKQVQS